MKSPKPKQPTEPKINELKATAYRLAKQIAGRNISQTKQLRAWIGDGVDFRKKSSWKVAIAILEEIIARDIVPQLLAA